MSYLCLNPARLDGAQGVGPGWTCLMNRLRQNPETLVCLIGTGPETLWDYPGRLVAVSS